MKRIGILLVLFVFLLSATTAAWAGAAAEQEKTLLTVYEGPRSMESSKTASVRVNGYELFVYDVMVNHEHIWNANTQPSSTPMTYFDFSGTVRLEIRMPGLEQEVVSAEVLPGAAGIVPEVKDGVVRFSVSEPGQYTVVFNGNVNKALHIFANPPEENVPDPEDPNVYYIGPGEWTMDAIVLDDDDTLYLSGGAVLHSIISVANAKNVRICGRGIIDGSDYPAWNQTGSYARVPVNLDHSKDVTVEDIIVINSNCWNVNSFSCRNVRMNNVKVISGRQNGDGFTFQSCTDHVVTNCFARTWDDSLVIKNYSGSSRGITFRDCQIWTDLAQSMEIGYETDKGLTLDPEISEVLFENITVLYNFHKPVISIHNSDDAFVHDITYRNILVEHAFMQGDNGNNKELIEMTLQNSSWSTVRDDFGRIDNVLIDGLTVLRTPEGKIPRSRFSGQDEDHQITNVTLRNVTILGMPVTSPEEMKLSVNDYCDGISVQFDLPSDTGAEEPAPDGDAIITIVPAPEQTQAERPPCFPDPADQFIQLPETENIAEGKPVQASAHNDVYVSGNLNDGKVETYWESKGFPAEVTIDLEEVRTISAAAVCLNPSAIWEPRTQEITVLVSLDGESFTEISPATVYQFDAATGNRIRIDFKPAEAAWVRFIISTNSAYPAHSGGAQAAEICVY